MPMPALKQKIIKLLSSGFYLGYLPLIPATWGSCLAIPFIFLIQILSPPVRIIVLLVIIILSIYLADLAEKIFSKRDDKKIVIDEIVGFLLAMAFIPLSLFYLILGLIIFRFLDVIKPPPADWAQNLPGGWGIVLDDILAGLYTAGLLFLITLIT